MNDAPDWIETLQMQRHPEGGWFSEVYRSHETISRECLPARFDGARSFSTAIYFLLEHDDFSALHLIRQDELWHFYDGSALTVHQIDPTGHYATINLGRELQSDERPLGVVPAGFVFGATVDTPGSYSLIGCTVAPGFSFDDFSMPEREQLVEQFPQHRDIIEQLTR